ncbi:hypothetical protein [Limosilactobacillus mucosae]|uniref:hypothetical protein n=1 Tax=Limosilactobacillus mucosae TaxID=97478 RepID=UPI0022E71F13|nr:hypothetical protein [Limosilactobacillus mucosae]
MQYEERITSISAFRKHILPEAKAMQSDETRPACKEASWPVKDYFSVLTPLNLVPSCLTFKNLPVFVSRLT